MHVLRFLGGASIEGSEGPVVGPAAQPRRLAFLAFLAAARGQPVSRDKLIGVLWPESTPESARHAVRDSIYVLNQQLDDAPIEVVGNALRIDPARCTSDVAAFQTAIESGDLEQAVGLYGGGFLDGLFLTGALEFEEWEREERDRYSRAYAQALEKLAERASLHGDYLQAVSWWRDLVAHDPHSDRAVARLMEALAAAGDRAEALRQADAYAVLMRETFDVAPDEEVMELARQLREESAKETRTGGAKTVPKPQDPPAWTSRRHWSSAAVVAVILGFAVWYLALKDDGPGPELAPGASVAPAIAVLPFSVRGEGLDALHEGMVDLLSTGLDGAAGLRTIPAGTLLARWREHVPGEETPELTIALEVARGTRARYALVGSVVTIDSDVRIVVDIYEMNTDERLGQVKVEGSPDDVLPLVDQLAVEVLRVVLQRGEEELPEIDLAHITTDSPEALRAFMEAEVHFRHMDLTAAEDAYKRAVDADSAFAYAHWRLSKVYRWKTAGFAMEGSFAMLSEYHERRAVELVDGLPPREASVLLASWTSRRRPLEAIDSLRQLVRRHPEDAQAWFELGELLTHVPGVLATAEEVDQPFVRAVELDPRNGLYRVHHYEYAWMIHADSTEAVLRRGGPRWNLSSRTSVVGVDSTQMLYDQLAFDLAFGDSVVQAEAIRSIPAKLSALGDLPCERVNHPRFHEAGIACYGLAVTLCECSGPALQSFRMHARWRGRFREGLRYLSSPPMTATALAAASYQASALGLPISAKTLEDALDPAVIDSTPGVFIWFDSDRHIGALYAGAYAADRGRWSDHQRAIAALKERAARALAESDSISMLRDERGVTGGETSMHLSAAAKALEGYELWRRGQPAAALPLLEDWRALHYWIVRWWLGGLYQELGRLRDAERVYRSWTYMNPLSLDPLVQRELGKIYEQLEEYDKAHESYAYFVESWQDADPELQPMVEEARQALNRLRGLQRE